MGEVVRVILYSRVGCHLCDEARTAILAERRSVPFGFDEVLIDGNEDLERRFGLRVPVVTVNGREEFELSVQAARFRRLVSG
ncbi:MAG TPA: glutaredoxin family protein [Actinomycetota bacterium]